MDEIKKFMKVLTAEQKQQKWKNIILNRITFFQDMAERYGKTELSHIASAELDGSTCPRCRKKWKEIKFDNQFLSGTYYQPDCECYFHCPNCKTFLYEVQVLGLFEKKYNSKCPNCNFQLITDEKEIRHGKKYEEYFDSLTRKQKFKLLSGLE